MAKREKKSYSVELGPYGVFFQRFRIANASKFDLEGKLVDDYVVPWKAVFRKDIPIEYLVPAYDAETWGKSEVYMLQAVGDADSCCMRIGMPGLNSYGEGCYQTPYLGEGVSWLETLSKLPYHFVYDGELFPMQDDDYKDDAGYLTLVGDNRSFAGTGEGRVFVETHGEFDPSKLEIHCKSYRNASGLRCFVSGWISYDGEMLNYYPRTEDAESKRYVQFAWVDSSLGRTTYEKFSESRDGEGNLFEPRWKKEPGKITITTEMTLSDCAEYCRPEVSRYPSGNKWGVINDIKHAFKIKSAFNSKDGITDAIAEKIYGLLLNRKVFSEENGKIIWPV